MKTDKPTVTSSSPEGEGGPSPAPAADFAPRGSRTRVGTDIVAVKNVAESIAKFGERYLARVFTPSERAYCTEAGRDAASHLAARFAAKEATMKALRPEGDAIDWQSIEVVRMPGGHHVVLREPQPRRRVRYGGGRRRARRLRGRPGARARDAGGGGVAPGLGARQP
jgi:phosphopantetheine--protein transferase-like protein